MANPNQPSYGRLQIDTTNKVGTTSSEVGTDKGRQGVGGSQGGGFKFGPDGSGAYRTPQTLLGAVAGGLPGVVSSISDMQEASRKWSNDFDEAVATDQETQYRELINSDAFLGMELEEDRAKAIDNLYATFDSQFITDKYKDEQRVRRIQSSAATRRAQGTDTVYSFKKELSDVAKLPPQDRIEMIERYEAAGDSILDARLREEFRQMRESAVQAISNGWKASNEQVVSGFKTHLEQEYRTKAQIEANGPTTRDAFIGSVSSAFLDTYSGLTDEQRAMGAEFLQSIAADQWDRAQFQTGRELGMESIQAAGLAVKTQDVGTLVSIMNEQTVDQGMLTLTDALAYGNWGGDVDAESFAIRVANQVFQNPASLQDFLRSVPQLPDAISDPAFKAVHQAAMKDSEAFMIALESNPEALDRATMMYARRTVGAAKLTNSRGEPTPKSGSTDMSPDEKRAQARGAAMGQVEEQIRAEQGLKADAQIPAELTLTRFREMSSTPGAGLHLSTTREFNSETLPMLMNSVSTLPDGPAREQALATLARADSLAAQYIADILERGGDQAMEMLDLRAPYHQYVAGMTSASLGGTAMAPGALAATIIENMPDNDHTAPLRRQISGAAIGMTNSLLEGPFYDNATGFRRQRNHLDAGTFSADYASSPYKDLASAQQSNYYKSVQNVITRTGQLYRKNDSGQYELNVDAVNNNPDLIFAIPSLMDKDEQTFGQHPGIRDLASQAIRTLMPPHVASLYDNAAPGSMLRFNIQHMTRQLLNNIESPEEAGTFFETFPDRLETMQLAASDPAAQAAGVESLKGVNVFSLEAFSTSFDLGNVEDFGRSTLQEDTAHDRWFNATPLLRAATAGLVGERSHVRYAEEEAEAMDAVLAERYKDVEKTAEDDTDPATANRRRYQAELQQAASAALLEEAMKDPTFRTRLTMQLATSADYPNKALQNALSGWMENNDVTITMMPNPEVLGAGSTIETNPAGILSAPEIAFTAPAKDIKFHATSVPTVNGGSLKTVDGSSQYSDSLRTNDATLVPMWDVPGVDVGTAVATTNSASRQFLTEDQVTTLNDELVSTLAERFQMTPEAVRSQIPNLLDGSEISSTFIREAGADGEDGLRLTGNWESIQDQGIDPRLGPKARAGYRQYSVERAINLMFLMEYARGGSSGDNSLTMSSLEEFSAIAHSIVPSTMSVKDGESEMQGRHTLFGISDHAMSRPVMSLRGSFGTIKVDSTEFVTRAKKLLTTGSDMPNYYYPGGAPEPPRKGKDFSSVGNYYMNR